MSKKSSPGFRCLDLVIALFTAVLITSNIASSAKIIDLGFSVFGIPLAFDGGTLLFPIAYVAGDLLTEVYGFRAARRAIWIGFIALALSSLFFFALRLLPGEEAWENSGGSAAYQVILGGMSSGGLVLASLCGYLTGGFFNSAIHSRVKVLTEGRLLWLRAIGSSVAGELLDSLVFVGAASLAGVFPKELFVTLVFTNWLFKLSVEIFMIPFCYLSVWILKKTEGRDVYDRGITYNPFKFG